MHQSGLTILILTSIFATGCTDTLAESSDGTGSSSVASESSTGPPTSSSTVGPSSTAPESSSGHFVGCGDAVIEGDEACDDGNQDDSDFCTNTCTLPICGDSLIQADEACDDGDESAICDADCTPVICGDGVRNIPASEACDDGNSEPGDACSTHCEPTKIRSLAVGGEFACIAFESGTVRCWGQGEYGAMGSGETDDFGNAPGELPVADILLGGPVQALAAGMRHVCALLESGVINCWGYNGQGQLGHKQLGTAVGDLPGEMPPPAVPLDTPARSIAAGQKHTCAILAGKSVRCWGDASYGALGQSSLTVGVPGISNAEQLALGANYSCVRLETGEVRCWGANDFGQLGLGHTNAIDTLEEMPPDPVDLGGDLAVEISAGTSHSCARTESGKLRCWGRGFYGALGNGALSDVGAKPDSLPVPPVVLDEAAARVATGSLHSCAVLASGAVRCWGDGRFGVLGYGDTQKLVEPPSLSLDLGGAAQIIASGGGSFADAALGTATCALLLDDSLRCWGSNAFGQLGQGNVENIGDDETPFNARVPF